MKDSTELNLIVKRLNNTESIVKILAEIHDAEKKS